MATITTDTYLDGGTARTAGEAWTINSGAKFTIRTDTRWHLNSPASYTGSVSSITCNEGEMIFDGRNVRWIAITSGSGTAAIGDTITQGAVSGYFLGFWSSLTAQPSLTISATGFIKLREVTGGTFSAGALTFSGGGAATAASADVPGWIEIVADANTTMTFPRLGKHTIRGDWFYLNNTDGTLGQTIQLPTNGGGANTFCPGIWVETAPSSNAYEYWPALTATSGWARQHLGAAVGETDVRQNFVKDIGSGQVQFGESSSLAGTYANLAAQASTYVGISHSSTYTVVSNICTITYNTGHALKTGAQVGIDFTSGGASALDNTFTITVIDAYNYTFPLTTGNTSGNATVRPGLTVSFTGHTLGIGDTVYCDFTTGSGVDGNYTIYAVTTANAYLLAYPSTTAITSGAVSVHSRYTITFTAHALAIGNRVKLDFTSGAGIDGIYTIVEVPDANTFRVVMNNNGSADSGNVSIQQTIGNIPTSGCKIKIPNVILRECPTATRSSNQITTAAATRPEWATTSAGAIDFEYAYTTWYMNFAQPYQVRLQHSSTYDSLLVTELATPLDIIDMHTSMYGSLDIGTFICTSNFAGGIVSNCKFQRGNTPGSSDHCIAIDYCKNVTFSNVTGGIIQYVRSTGKGFNITYSKDLIFNNCRGINSDFPMTVSQNIKINNHDHCDRYIGYTNASSPYYGVTTGAGCSQIEVNGLSFGFNNTILNIHPYYGAFYTTATSNSKFRNVGSKANPVSCGTWRTNLYSLRAALATNGNCDNIKFQRMYFDENVGGIFNTTNSDKNMVYESVYSSMYAMSLISMSLLASAGLNMVCKGIKASGIQTTGQLSVYGNSFSDIFLGDFTGRLTLAFNEPTAETVNQFTMVSGTAKFNSSGGILMGIIGDQAIFEDSCFRLGHTGFVNTAPIMSGGTIGNYTLEYQMDIGEGYSGSWVTLNGTNLSAITIDPSIGFKIKIRITTTSTNATAITYLRIDTISTASAQENNLYPLDLVDINLYGYITGSDIVILSAGTTTEIVNVNASSGTSYTVEADPNEYTNIDVCVYKKGYVPFILRNISFTSEGLSLPINQVVDRNYID